MHWRRICELICKSLFAKQAKKRVAQVTKLELPSLYQGDRGAKFFVLRPEGVYEYVERAKTEKENDFVSVEKFEEFQPKNTCA
jgi:hypothetical protein